MLGDTDSDIEGLTLVATDGLELTEYWLDAMDGLMLRDGLPDSDIDGEAGREYRDGLPELAEYGRLVCGGDAVPYGLLRY